MRATVLRGGKLGATLRGAPVCLVTTTGRKSGTPRTVPLLYLRDGDNVVLVASKGGWDDHPLWYRNMRADPQVTVEVEGEKLTMTAVDAPDDVKAAYWPKLVAMYPDYARYQSWTDRRIPVVVLTTSKAEEDILCTYDLGVNSYITKPMTFDGLVDVMRELSRYWLEIVELPTSVS